MYLNCKSNLHDMFRVIFECGLFIERNWPKLFYYTKHVNCNLNIQTYKKKITKRIHYVYNHIFFVLLNLNNGYKSKQIGKIPKQNQKKKKMRSKFEKQIQMY